MSGMRCGWGATSLAGVQPPGLGATAAAAAGSMLLQEADGGTGTLMTTCLL
jgi:hypothetical protein